MTGLEDAADRVTAERAAADAFHALLADQRDGRPIDPRAALRALPEPARPLLRRLLADLELIRRRRAAAEAGPREGLGLGPYRLLRRLGRGAASTVWEARDERLERRVALKILDPRLALSEHQQARFVAEARLAASLELPGVCSVHDVGFERGLHYLVVELVPEGRTLATLLAEDRARPWSLGRALERAGLVARVGRALAGVHARGVAHLDLKPSNVLLRPDGTPLVTDFGLSTRVDVEPSGGDPPSEGTPAYAAPEQVAGRGLPDLRSDVFSLGVTLHECLTGRRPFTGTTAAEVGRAILEDEPTTPSGLCPELPAELDRICALALAKDPAGRPPDAGALADDLERFLRGPGGAHAAR